MGRLGILLHSYTSRRLATGVTRGVFLRDDRTHGRCTAVSAGGINVMQTIHPTRFSLHELRKTLDLLANVEAMRDANFRGAEHLACAFVVPHAGLGRNTCNLAVVVLGPNNSVVRAGP